MLEPNRGINPALTPHTAVYPGLLPRIGAAVLPFASQRRKRQDGAPRNRPAARGPPRPPHPLVAALRAATHASRPKGRPTQPSVAAVRAASRAATAPARTCSV